MEFMRHRQGFVIEGKAGGSPNIEQPTMALKKKLEKNSDYGIILHIGVPSHISRVLINKK